MVKLLIIADDFTGALDTGVQFAASGAETRVITNTEYDFRRIEKTVQVLVLEAETRHLKPEDAYRTVYEISKRAYESGIPFIYKKTDSALRGNIGSELKAVIDATKQLSLHFLPAFPRMNRVTKNGIHYIDEVPVHESVFGKDPFEPVTCSYIPDMIQPSAEVTVVEDMDRWEQKPGVMVYDAQTEEELIKAGTFLLNKGELHIMAGCAGFAAVLPTLLGLKGSKRKEVALSDRFLVACGSVNPITKSQLDYAEQNGFHRIRLTPEQKLDTGYYETGAGKEALDAWKQVCRRERRCIIDTNDEDGCGDTLAYAEELGISMEELRVRISTTLGFIIKELVNAGIDSTLLITGGDCLVGFMKHIGCDEISPVCEMAPGTVLSEIELQNRAIGVITKSGGFGQETLLTDLAGTILGEEEEKKVC